MKKLLTLFTAAMLGLSTLASTAAPIQTKPAAATQQHLKKDGTPDKRYKENQTPKGPLKKDGTPDMRHKVNKTTTVTKKTTPAPKKAVPAPKKK